MSKIPQVLGRLLQLNDIKPWMTDTRKAFLRRYGHGVMINQRWARTLFDPGLKPFPAGIMRLSLGTLPAAVYASMVKISAQYADRPKPVYNAAIAAAFVEFYLRYGTGALFFQPKPRRRKKKV